MEKGVSVIICCYNSSARLPETLNHLAGQNLYSGSEECINLEIILVNNNSTDNTVEVAENYRQRIEISGIRLRIVNEEKPGQMYARIKGVEEAENECIVFCDDDNRLNREYIFLSFLMLDSDKNIGAGGGQNIPLPEVKPPEWFDDYKNYYGTGIPANDSGDVSYKMYVIGAGMVTRKSLFLKLFGSKFPTLLAGRNGQHLSTGDDFEYCKRLILLGYSLHYESKMILYHFIPKERLTLEYRERLMKGIDEAGNILGQYDLAIRVHHKIKRKNRWRLLLLSPFRILFSSLGWSRRILKDEQLTLYYLSPITLNKKSPKYIIKKLIQSNKNDRQEKKK